jgi:hypothetical protein
MLTLSLHQSQTCPAHERDRMTSAEKVGSGEVLNDSQARFACCLSTPRRDTEGPRGIQRCLLRNRPGCEHRPGRLGVAKCTRHSCAADAVARHPASNGQTQLVKYSTHGQHSQSGQTDTHRRAEGLCSSLSAEECCAHRSCQLNTGDDGIRAADMVLQVARGEKRNAHIAYGWQRHSPTRCIKS